MVARTALPFYSVPAAWTNIGGLASSSGCKHDTAWGCVADSIHRSADETGACAAGGEEIRARIQHEQMRRTRRSACCNRVAALLQQHCSPCVQSKVCAYLPPGEPVLICHCAPVHFHVRICCGYAPIANNGAGNEWPQVDCDCQGGCYGAAC